MLSTLATLSAPQLGCLIIAAAAIAALVWVWRLRHKVAARAADLAQAKTRLEQEVEERKKTAAELDPDQIHSLVDELLAAHGDLIPELA